MANKCFGNTSPLTLPTTSSIEQTGDGSCIFYVEEECPSSSFYLTSRLTWTLHKGSPVVGSSQAQEHCRFSLRLEEATVWLWQRLQCCLLTSSHIFWKRCQQGTWTVGLGEQKITPQVMFENKMVACTGEPWKSFAQR